MSSSSKPKRQLVPNKRDALFNLPIYPGKRPGETSAHTWKVAQTFSIQNAQRKLQSIPEEEWLRRGQKRALALFHAASRNVPAYKEFLKKNKVRPSLVKTYGDLEQVPLTTKENYITKHSLESLCWYGRIDLAHTIVASSGSYGKPSLWPRGDIREIETMLEHELAMVPAFNLQKKKTLVVIGFAMGMHIAGTATMQGILHLARKGYPISVITPGYVTENILMAVENLSSKYDQTILAGYPPFMKEVIDQGVAKGIRWKKINLKFLFAGEGFNESWRSYMAQLTNTDPSKDLVNIYGSADTAAIGHETALSIVIRRRAAASNLVQASLFEDDRLPSLYQYYPEHKWVESVNDEIIITTPGQLPLIRYDIHDTGSILTAADIMKREPVLAKEFDRLRKQSKVWNLPFVYVFGRNNQTSILYGANIYLEHIKHALENQKLRQIVSGKIVMATEENNQHDQELHIHIEVGHQIKPTAVRAREITDAIHNTLLRINSEYKVIHQGLGDKVIPKVFLYEYGKEQFHQAQMKHRWTHNPS